MQINTSQDLDAAIEELERRKVIQESILKDQFHTTIEHFKPGNLIKGAFRKVIEPGDTRSTILKTAGGLGAGLVGFAGFFFGDLATSDSPERAED